jgi:hypothetical protein
MDRSAALPLVTTPDLPSARAESGRVYLANGVSGVFG